MGLCVISRFFNKTIKILDILDPFTIFKNGKEYTGNNNLLPLDGSHNKKYDHGSAVAASEGLSINKCLNNLQSFQGVKEDLNMLEILEETIYDDFAHHQLL